MSPDHRFVQHFSRITIGRGVLVGFVIVAGCRLPTGLTHSRWGMEDEQYAAKYADGADKDDPLGKLKQANDARFLDGTEGFYVSTGGSYRPSTGGGAILDVGKEWYDASFLTHRLSLMGTAGWDQLSLGADTGIRLQTPTRTAPFVGVGAFAGPNWQSELADQDRVDNDDDEQIDEPGERSGDINALFVAVYPEVGVHFWWTPRVRLTGFGRYWVTTDGRDQDDWLIGAGLAVFER